jgi:TolB-like protein
MRRSGRAFVHPLFNREFSFAKFTFSTLSDQNARAVLYLHLRQDTCDRLAGRQPDIRRPGDQERNIREISAEQYRQRIARIFSNYRKFIHQYLMPSLIPEYAFDIFISYRHKDNKYDGWVTEFVSNLKKEVAATLKEDISIYFDENPHDGILDTDNVEETIANKIRCLAFIPILSQTYCDPNSFAWNNEFLAFIKFASEDSRGLNIKLINGNVTSRIIPVRIHDLDAADRSLFEQATKSGLRSVDFVFKGPGVNRPLGASEHRPGDNQNKIYYRDQINKVANLLKEVIAASKIPINRNVVGIPAPAPEKTSFRINKIPIAALALIALSSLFYFLASAPLFRGVLSGSEMPTLAILPFKVIDNGEESGYFAEGVTETIRFNLSMFPQLKVMSRTSVEKYRDGKKSIEEVADELRVIYILEGSAQKIRDDIRIIAQLVDTRNKRNVWSQRFDKKFKNLFDIQNEISEAIARALKATLTSEISTKLRKAPTANFEAYDLFLRARQLSKRYALTKNAADLHAAIKLVQQSLHQDPEFATGYAWFAGLKILKDSEQLSLRSVRDSIVLLANTALMIDSSVTEANVVLSEMYTIENDDVNALRYTFNALRSPAPDSALTYSLMKRLATVYARVGYTDRAVLLLDRILDSDPYNLDILHSKFYALAADHRIDDLRRLAGQIRSVNAGDIYPYLIETHILLENEQYGDIEKIYDSIKGSLKDQLYVFDQYAIVYAWVLRDKGRTGEAELLADLYAQSFGEDPYFNAHLQLFEGKNKRALALLKDENVGWYNLNFCRLSPVFSFVATEGKLKMFFERNEEILAGKKERIRQLETKGYLESTENLFASDKGRLVKRR